MISKLFKRKHKKKLFTLIEILSAVLIIAFLAAFVVPKIGAVKDNAKVAGVDTNTRMVQAYVQSVVHNYDSTQVDLFEKELTDAFTEEDLVNPFNKGKGVGTTDGLATKKVAVMYASTDNTKAGVSSTWESNTFSAKKDYQGTVLIAAYPDPNGIDGIEVALIPFNKNGKPLLSKKVIIKQ